MALFARNDVDEFAHAVFANAFSGSPVFEFDDVGLGSLFGFQSQDDVLAAVLRSWGEFGVETKTFKHRSHHAFEVAPFKMV